MEQRKLVPKRRFAGYTDAWEQRKFFDNFRNIIDFRGRTPKKLGLDWSKSGYLALSALNVKDGYIDRSADAHYGNQELYDKWMAGNELKQGQVLFTTEAPMGNVAQVPDNSAYILSQRTIAFNVKSEMMTDDFLFVLLRSPNVFNALSALSSGGTAKGVSQKSMSQLNIIVPRNLDEQTQIASLIKGIDNLITLHQRKLEKIKNLKSAYLIEMFPAEGERVPKRRFAEFVDEWKQFHLGELLELENGYAFNSKYFKEERTTEIVTTPGNVNVGGGFQSDKGHYYDISGTFPSNYILKPGDIFLTMTDLTPSAQTLGFPAIIPDDGNIYLHNQRLGKLVNYKGNKHFLFNLLCIEQYHKQIVMTASGTTVKHTSPDKILDCLVNIPSAEEQLKIATFFNKIDRTIAINQDKLNKVKALKQAYLYEMFV